MVSPGVAYGGDADARLPHFLRICRTARSRLRSWGRLRHVWKIAGTRCRARSRGSTDLAAQHFGYVIRSIARGDSVVDHPASVFRACGAPDSIGPLSVCRPTGPPRFAKTLVEDYFRSARRDQVCGRCGRQRVCVRRAQTLAPGAYLARASETSCRLRGSRPGYTHYSASETRRLHPVTDGGAVAIEGLVLLSLTRDGSAVWTAKDDQCRPFSRPCCEAPLVISPLKSGIDVFVTSG